MSIIKLHFQDSNGQALDDLDVSYDVPIVKMMPSLIKELELDRQADWQLILGETNQLIDKQQTFSSLGIRDGSVIQMRSGQTVLGRYEIRRKIGEGGMGVIYEGYDPNLGRQVAIKVIKEDIANNSQMMQRFAREARSVARLSNHNGIVAVYDFNHDNPKQPFFVMEYVEGVPLDDLISQRNGLALDEVAHILTKVAEALDAAHAQGIIHRDIKPSNILVQMDKEQKWFPKLMDFGLVKISEEASDLTQTGTVMGSPHYMSPEQIDGERLTRQSDIYSLGVVVYEMLTGRRPFQDSTNTRILLDHIRTPPPPPRQFRGDMPPQVENVVLKALSKKAEERYDTAGEFAQAFVTALKKPESPKRSLPSPKVIALALSAVVLLCAFALTLIWAIFLRPPSISALFKEFERQMEAQQYHEAELILGQVLSRQPDNASAINSLLDLADKWEDAGDLDASIKIYEKVTQVYDPGNEEPKLALLQAYMRRAQKSVETGDIAAAEADLLAVLQLDGDNFHANLSLGNIRFDGERYSESISHYLAALAVDGSSAQARTNLAWTYYHTGRFEQAIPEFIKLGNSTDSFKGSGLSYIGLQWYEDALPVLVPQQTKFVG